MCWHCSQRFESLNLTVTHAAAVHPTEQVKVRIRRLDETTGKEKFVTKTYDIIPKNIHGDLMVSGEKITIVPQQSNMVAVRSYTTFDCTYTVTIGIFSVKLCMGVICGKTFLSIQYE